MARSAERIPAFEELYLAVQALPEGLTGEILEDGRIEAKGRPGRAHTRAAKRLLRALGAVDWACEILSPSTERKDRAVKLPIYARAEIPQIWLVDPERRRVEVYEPREGVAVRTLVAEGSAIAALPPFPELELPLASLWGR